MPCSVGFSTRGERTRTLQHVERPDARNPRWVWWIGDRSRKLVRYAGSTMIILPKIRQNICLTAHPVGCQEQVREQIAYVGGQPPVEGPKRVLVVGSSNGYGLAARIVSAFSCGAATAGVFLERPGAETRTATVLSDRDSALVSVTGPIY